MRHFYVARLPYSSSWHIYGRARDRPWLRPFAFIAGLLWFVVLLVVGLAVLVIDLLLVPVWLVWYAFRFGRWRRRRERERRDGRSERAP